MKFLVLFAASLLCVQAYNIPYGFYDDSSESSEEEYSVLVTANNQPPLSLPGVGIYNQPILQAVKVKVPRYLSPEIKQQIITQTIAARGLTLQDFAAAPSLQGGLNNVAPTSGLFVRQQRQVPAAAAVNKGVSLETGPVTDKVVLTDEDKGTLLTPVRLSASVVPELPMVPAVPMIL
nr:uncharacterized protein LOC106616363 [Bactrocera oleae]